MLVQVLNSFKDLIKPTYYILFIELILALFIFNQIIESALLSVFHDKYDIIVTLENVEVMNHILMRRSFNKSLNYLSLFNGIVPLHLHHFHCIDFKFLSSHFQTLPNAP